MNITSTDVKVDFRINKMSRNIYNQLCSNGYIQSHPFDLYLVDDDNYDVQNKRVVNMAEPETATDGANLGYIEQNFVSKKDIKECEDNSFYIQNSKIISLDKNYAVSSDCCIYKKLSSDSDWKIVLEDSDFLPSQLTAGYESSTPPLGWFIEFPNGSSVVRKSFNDPERNKQKIDQKDFGEDGGVRYGKAYMIRDCWEYRDSLVKKSENAYGYEYGSTASEISIVLDSDKLSRYDGFSSVSTDVYLPVPLSNQIVETMMLISLSNSLSVPVFLWHSNDGKEIKWNYINGDKVELSNSYLYMIQIMPNDLTSHYGIMTVRKLDK